ncbi:MAG TPA: hypothetical protein VFW95_08730 [Candidatus Limnocylindria bacterium]|nr:hypothetical protein [Candidatus Limnocylindria bacterium]
MGGRVIATCGWLAWQLRRVGGRPLPVIIGVAFLILAFVPFVIPLLDPQPTDTTAQAIRDGKLADPKAWVRMEGRIQPLADSPTGEAGNYALFVDKVNPLRAIVVRSDHDLAVEPDTTISGRLATAIVDTEGVTEALPIEATVFGTPPQIEPGRVIDLDAAPKAARVTWWPLAILPILLGIALLVGVRVGYPIFRPSSEVDVVSAPLGPGERVPAAYGGRIGKTVADLGDPAGALLLVRRGPKGNILTAQPLADGGGVAPQPVTIGGGWTTGRVGHVFARNETVPALRIRSEQVDATFLFAKTSERDRIAALVAVER